MNQRQAFLAQAVSDFSVFELLQARPDPLLPECHALHYLQMATEKLAKAVTGAPTEPVRQDTHVAFSLLQYTLRNGN